MGIHWCDKRAATAEIGRALEARGWKLYGWKEDRSDSMTDYYDPESWKGVATKDGAVVVVDVAPWLVQQYSGRVPERMEIRRHGTCERCEGSGVDPVCGWTLAEARANPRGFREAEAQAQREIGRARTVSILAGMGVISPIPFEKHGRRTCEKCHGFGHGHAESVNVATEAERWPEFQANPPRCSWHVERGGRIVAKGTGVFSVESDWDARNGEEPRPKLARLLERIESAAAPRSGSVSSSSPAEPVESVTVRPGKRAGFVEILFPEKPSADVRAEMKAARFRWSRSGGCWYGPEANVPACVAEAVRS